MEILYPMFGMIFVTAIVMMLLYISRIQALSNRSKNPNRLPNEVARHSDEIRKYMTPRNRFITENYNHLFEQPTLFYAVVIYIFLMGNSDLTHLVLAWGYVLFRAIHSVYQLTHNQVKWRATIFGIGGAFLVIMIAREAISLLTS